MVHLKLNCTEDITARACCKGSYKDDFFLKGFTTLVLSQERKTRSRTKLGLKCIFEYRLVHIEVTSHWTLIFLFKSIHGSKPYCIEIKASHYTQPYTFLDTTSHNGYLNYMLKCLYQSI